MAWTDLTFSSGSKLTSTKMTQVQSNFAALAGGESGAPPISVNSVMWAGVASGGFVNVSSGFQTTEAGSFGTVNVTSSFQADVGSLASVDVSSWMKGPALMVTGASSLGSITVNSGLLLAVAPSPPVANEAYRENIIGGWINFNGTTITGIGGTTGINDSYNVASVDDNGTGNYDVNWNTDFANNDYAVVATVGTGLAEMQIIVAQHNTGFVRFNCERSDTNAVIDCEDVNVIAIGDLA